MSKKDKEFQKLLRQKTLSSAEAVRLLQLDGWFPDRNTSGTSHQQFEHLIKKGKITVPSGRKTLPEGTRKSILEQAGLKEEIKHKGVTDIERYIYVSSNIRLCR